MTITLRAGVLNSGIQQNGTEFLTVDTSNNATLSNNLTVTGNTILGDASTDTLNVGNGGLVKDASGNVGIGTNGPASKLDVYSSGQVDTTGASGKWTSRLRDTNNTAATGSGGSLLFMGSKSIAGAGGNFAGIAGLKENSTDSNEQGYLAMYTTPVTGVITERMRITSAGGVSFGATGTAVGTTGQVLVSQGDAAPVWTATSGISAGIGVGQTYSAPSRVYSTTYTNSGDKPIFIIVSGSNTTANVASTASLLVNSVVVAIAKGGGAGSGLVANSEGTMLTGIIPVGGTYSVTPTSSTLLSWYELS